MRSMLNVSVNTPNVPRDVHLLLMFTWLPRQLVFSFVNIISSLLRYMSTSHSNATHVFSLR